MYSALYGPGSGFGHRGKKPLSGRVWEGSHGPAAAPWCRSGRAAAAGGTALAAGLQSQAGPGALGEDVFLGYAPPGTGGCGVGA